MRHTHRTSLLVASVLGAALLGCGPAGDPGGQGGQGADDPTAEDPTAEDPTADTDGGDDPDDEQDADTLVADVVGADGTEHGRVTFSRSDGGVLVDAALEGFDGPGFHGFHLHEDGRCDPDDPAGAFDSAGGHLGSDVDDHPAHAGDLPPLQVTDDGRALLTVRSTRFSLEELANADAALIVHLDPDNLGHVPPRYVLEDTGEAGPDEETLDTGDAGDRLACGVVLAPQGE